MAIGESWKIINTWIYYESHDIGLYTPKSLRRIYEQVQSDGITPLRSPSRATSRQHKAGEPYLHPFPLACLLLSHFIFFNLATQVTPSCYGLECSYLLFDAVSSIVKKGITLNNFIFNFSIFKIYLPLRANFQGSEIQWKRRLINPAENQAHKDKGSTSSHLANYTSLNSILTEERFLHLLWRNYFMPLVT